MVVPSSVLDIQTQGCGGHPRLPSILQVLWQRVHHCQRLCARGALTPATRQQVETAYLALNPLRLRRELDAALAVLWRLMAAEPVATTAVQRLHAAASR